MVMAGKIKKSINIWSFPGEMSIAQCIDLAKKAGFEGIELALSADGELSLSGTDDELAEIKRKADEAGVEIASIATGLFWQFSLTSNREDIREKAKQVVRREIDIAAKLGVDSILVCPGTVGVDFKPDEVVPDAGNIEFFAGSEVIDYDVAYARSQEALKELAPYAEEKGVVICIENIWNKFLLSPLEFRSFIDEIGSPYVQVYLDVGNMVLFGYPEQWIKILGSRIKRIHFKDFRRGTAQLMGFVELLTGDVSWDKVVEALHNIGYESWVSAEMCPPYKLYPDQNIYNASAAMDRILGMK